MPSVHHSAVIASPAESVWRATRDFLDVSWAPGVLEECVAVGERTGDRVGCRRILNGVFHETLLALDDHERTMKYRLDDGPSPVSSREVRDFVATLRVRPVTEADTALVEFSARWESQDDAAADFAGGIYQALLGALQKRFARGGLHPVVSASG